ncbi:MAG TPA: hypothetical protein VMU19_07150 [Bryobacteraceae bacterium]|nr:hypothetical protein [Bryobacteraceae bacterium]
MPLYRVYRMKDTPRQQFRWAPHVSGCASVKPKDFEQRGEVEARNEYEAWRVLRESDDPIAIGDVLETQDGQLRLCKYVGLEPAEWVIPEPKRHEEPTTADPAAAAPVP